MPQKIHDTIKDVVVEKWLSGYSRNSIAIECQISTGAVSNIVEEWTHLVGPDLANLLRGLAVTLRKLGMSPAQCASGLRMVNLIGKMGLDVNSIESYLSEIYTHLKEINPKYVARYLEGLVSLVQDLNVEQGERANATSIQKIDTILDKKRQYNVQLQNELNLHKSRLQDINQQIIKNEKRLEDLLEKNRILEQETGWNSQIRDELRKYKLDVNSVSSLVNGARFFSDNNHNVSEMLVTYSEYQKLLSVVATQKATLKELTDRFVEIQVESKAEEDLLQQRRLKNAELDSLKNMGFGLGEFKTLHSLIVESTAEMGQSTENGAAVRNFISDIQDHYFDYKNLGKKIERLKNLESMVITSTSAQSQLGHASTEFVRKDGITQEDVNMIIKIMKLYTHGCMLNENTEPRPKQVEIKVASKINANVPNSNQPMTNRDVEEQVVRSTEGSDTVKQRKRGYASDSNITEMMNMAMGLTYHT